jgi:hypothetical protein
VETAENPTEMEMEEDEEMPEQDESTSYLPVTITITKSTDASALVVDTIIEDSQFTISDVMYYKDGQLASDKSTQGAEKRGELYDGPGAARQQPMGARERFPS